VSKLDIIKINWVNESEVHIYPPGNRSSWWARPVPNYLGEGEVWELHDGDDGDEVEGYYETPKDAFEAVSEKFDDAPVVVIREREL
jgi:hypothetical protein